MNAGKKGVIYTCITGGYDELLNHTFISPEWDYVCFSDDMGINNEKNAQWEIRPLRFEKLDDVRNQRWHKLHPHLLFPESGLSLWVDGNVDILDGEIFHDIDRALNANLLIAPSLHPERNCIYDEFDACRQLGKDDPDVMGRQEYLIKKDGFPKAKGLFETNIIFRCHSHPMVITIMEEWWYWVEQYSRRDQLGFTYVLWKNNYTVEPLSPVSYRFSPGVRFRYGAFHITKEQLIKEKAALEIKVQRFEALICGRLVKVLYKIRKSTVKRWCRVKMQLLNSLCCRK
ncbi:MAG TPA: DUF616 domain-containing protein [Chlorobaculum sp.]|uniref:TOD1/MUCI70 glycosyltransferase-like domain-containing protein n=1 Tax=Chlorobaculum tepidum (strain ATCC 49652 / DSM 12025 / NBRC 103806 / TLS) TaxID=194439 RepID=Q8KFV8_CHLTE|nr:glycosyltransferase domain-containing protein [Chlorobaculum tepidum]AAM71460.1 hypothetical protein CT0212 [Chlorobaculum tepidum TLS]HBU23688.1 DUF616 domain-containing protein [Chlorobaculum sp.]